VVYCSNIIFCSILAFATVQFSFTIAQMQNIGFNDSGYLVLKSSQPSYAVYVVPTFTGHP